MIYDSSYMISHLIYALGATPGSPVPPRGWPQAAAANVLRPKVTPRVASMALPACSITWSRFQGWRPQGISQGQRSIVMTCDDGSEVQWMIRWHADLLRWALMLVMVTQCDWMMVISGVQGCSMMVVQWRQHHDGYKRMMWWRLFLFCEVIGLFNDAYSTRWWPFKNSYIMMDLPCGS